MKVRAVKLGYYDHLRRRPGDEFVLSNPKHFSDKWMDKVEDSVPKTKKVVKAPAVENEGVSVADADVI